MEWIKTSWQEIDDKGLTFVMDFSHAVFQNKLPVDIAIDTVHRITQTYPKPYYLYVSGGVDSQSMLYAWHKSKIDFVPVFVRYWSDNIFYNQHDFETLKNFCDLYKINLNLLNFDVLKFLNTELESYVIRYRCTSPQICTYMKMSELVKDGTVIFSGNFLTPTSASLNYTIYGTQRYAEITRRDFVSRFFIHDKWLAPSFIEIYKKLEKDFDDPYKLKCQVYKDGGFPVIPQKEKYTGFEKIKEYFDKFPNLLNLGEMEKFKNKPSNRVFDIVFRYRYEELIKYNDNIKLIIPKNC